MFSGWFTTRSLGSSSVARYSAVPSVEALFQITISVVSSDVRASTPSTQPRRRPTRLCVRTTTTMSRRMASGGGGPAGSEPRRRRSAADEAALVPERALRHGLPALGLQSLQQALEGHERAAA